VRGQVSYTWRLSIVMASCDLYSASDMRPVLADRGISLSIAQLSRLISGTPLRISLPLLAALCDALACTPSDLIVVSTE
jgi:DNA-binding Xre family transcriptional regulator